MAGSHRTTDQNAACEQNDAAGIDGSLQICLSCPVDWNFGRLSKLRMFKLEAVT